MDTVNFNKKQSLIVFWILAVSAFIIRMLVPFDPGLSNDELSALNRIGYNSFTDLINLGIRIDGHPAGVQVLLHYYTKLIGSNSFLLRLPFYIASSLSVGVCYLIGEKLFNKSSSLIASSWLVGLQYFVHYGQLARPYAIGILFTLLLVYWLIKLNDSLNIKSIIIAGLLLSLCAYTHYFALLSALIACLAFFLAYKTKRITIASTVIIALVLFIPHFKITYYQLFELQGLSGWLGQPHLSFFSEYFNFLFHFSPILILLAILVFIWIFRKAIRKKLDKSNIVLTSIFIGTALVGYLYSIFLSPVLQYSVLVFSSPFLFLAFFCTKSKINFKTSIFLSLLIGLACISSLIIERNHSQVASLQSHKHISDQFQVYGTTLSTVGIIRSDPKYLEYYNQNIPTYFNSKDSLFNLHNILENLSRRTAFLYLAKEERWKYILAKEYFPKLNYRSNLIGAETYLLSKGARSIDDTKITRTTISIERFQNEYLILLNLNLQNDTINSSDFIEMEVTLSGIDNTKGINLVSRIMNNEKQIDWRKQQTELKSGNKNKLILAYRLSDVLTKNKKDYSIIEMVLENKNKKLINIEQAELRVTKGNPYYYGVISK